MKKIIVSALLCICTGGLYAQTTCSPAGYSQFDMVRSALRTGLFTAPNDSPDSIGCYAAAFGNQTKPKGYASLAIGNTTSTTGDYSFAGGSYSIASGQNAMATGISTLASGPNSASLGYSSKATSNQAVALGAFTTASGVNSLATGYGSTASGYASTTTGYTTVASGYSSTSMGYQTQANGDESFAGGLYSAANGSTSFAFGTSAHSSGYESTSMGSNTIASGIGSHTVGYYSKASGDYSLALGSYADTRAPNSVAMGNGTIAKAMFGTSLGFYNDSSDSPNPLAFGVTDRVFQVGIGWPSARNNALTILRNGNMGIGVLNPIQKLEVAGNIVTTGNVLAAGNITVQNKGIIRSVDGTQQKKLVANVTVNTTFTAGQTKTFTVTWPETFSGAPDGFIGSLVSGAGGWAEVVMTLGTASTTGVTLYVYNPKTTSVSPNFTVKVIAIGAQ